MCKWYRTTFACLCDHALKVVKPCSCYAERSAAIDSTDRLCDILQAAKEPIILKDHCTACATKFQSNAPAYLMAFEQQQQQGGAVAARHGRYYESSDVRDMPTVPVFSRWNGKQEYAVLMPQAFEAMFRLREMLPGLDEDADADEEQVCVEGGQVVPGVAEQQVATGEREMPVPTFSMEMVDRTRRW
ncbi:hypothetical protein LTR36_006581 [Oleoguttula mirabilis]|uniref:Uncharacterized protein n=1 Tax=Oleoguttula mirabilis TaxID=1507867 RepID=A0AAV9JW85_9PEZI|nr:hypothetical protein LTR36_006581 [Oleoguttula mirabilis]